MSSQELKQKGFTIIEVVLVLAIAALIFLMVFIALPALQRNQRDTQRRSDAGSFVSQISQYSTNNKGAIHDSAADVTSFVTNYMKGGTGGSFNDPKSGNPYTVTYSIGAPTTEGVIYYHNSATCDGETIINSTNPRIGAVAMKLEGAGVFCQETK